MFLKANASQNIDVSLEAGTRTLSGRLFDRRNPERGLSGVQVFSQSEDESKFTIAYTDPEGNWSMAVTSEVWKILVLPQAILHCHP